MEIINGIIETRDDIDSGSIGLPVGRDDENSLGDFPQDLGFPQLEEAPCWDAVVDGEQRRPMGNKESVHLHRHCQLPELKGWTFDEEVCLFRFPS